jgi:hypothetical protein
MLVGLGFLMLSTGHVRAGGDICPMTIEKVADPADDTEFNFSVTGGNIFDDILMDPSKPSFSFDLMDGNADTTVLEEVPPGWILNIECTVPGGTGCVGPGGTCLIITEIPNGLIFDCLDVAAGDNTCTFTNVKLVTNIPTLSEWGLIAMAGILGIVGFMVIRRRKVTA